MPRILARVSLAQLLRFGLLMAVLRFCRDCRLARRLLYGDDGWRNCCMPYLCHPSHRQCIGLIHRAAARAPGQKPGLYWVARYGRAAASAGTGSRGAVYTGRCWQRLGCPALARGPSRRALPSAALANVGQRGWRTHADDNMWCLGAFKSAGQTHHSATAYRLRPAPVKSSSNGRWDSLAAFARPPGGSCRLTTRSLFSRSTYTGHVGVAYRHG